MRPCLIEIACALVSAGELIVADAAVGRVCVMSHDGSALLRVLGMVEPADGLLTCPLALATAGSLLYVADGADRVVVYL